MSMDFPPERLVLDFPPCVPDFEPRPMETEPDSDTLTARQAARLAGCSTVWLAKLRARNKPPAYRRNGRFILYDRAEIERWCRDRQT